MYKNPHPGRLNEFTENGVFHGLGRCCDYLLYAGAKGNAPVKISITVLKGDPENTEYFDGVFLGTGAGVTWVRPS